MSSSRAWVQYVAPDKAGRDVYHRVPALVRRGRVRMWVWKPLCGAPKKQSSQDTVRLSADVPLRGRVCEECMKLEAQPRSRA